MQATHLQLWNSKVTAAACTILRGPSRCTLWCRLASGWRSTSSMIVRRTLVMASTTRVLAHPSLDQELFFQKLFFCKFFWTICPAMVTYGDRDFVESLSNFRKFRRVTLKDTCFFAVGGHVSLCCHVSPGISTNICIWNMFGQLSCIRRLRQRALWPLVKMAVAIPSHGHKHDPAISCLLRIFCIVPHGVIPLGILAQNISAHLSSPSEDRKILKGQYPSEVRCSAILNPGIDYAMFDRLGAGRCNWVAAPILLLACADGGPPRKLERCRLKDQAWEGIKTSREHPEACSTTTLGSDRMTECLLMGSDSFGHVTNK